jgi:hypothetical protein
MPLTRQEYEDLTLLEVEEFRGVVDEISKASKRKR